MPASESAKLKQVNDTHAKFIVHLAVLYGGLYMLDLLRAGLWLDVCTSISLDIGLL